MIYISKKHHTAWINHYKLRLSEREYQLLILLAEQSQNTVSKSDILKGIWGTEFKSDSVAVLLINDLRRRICDNAGQVIATVHGHGYQLNNQVTWQCPPHVQLLNTVIQCLKKYRWSVVGSLVFGLIILLVTIMAQDLKDQGSSVYPQLEVLTQKPLIERIVDEDMSPSGRYRLRMPLTPQANTLTITDLSADKVVHEIPHVSTYHWLESGDFLLYFSEYKRDAEVPQNIQKQCDIRLFDVANRQQLSSMPSCQSAISNIRDYRKTDAAISYDNQYIFYLTGQNNNSGKQFIRKFNMPGHFSAGVYPVVLPHDHIIVGLLATPIANQLIALTKSSQGQDDDEPYHAFRIDLQAQQYRYLAPVQQDNEKKFLVVLMQPFLVLSDGHGGLFSVHTDSAEVSPLITSQQGQITELLGVAENQLQITLDQKNHYLLSLRLLGN